MVPRRGQDGLDDGTAADLSIDRKIPSRNGHADDHVSQRRNEIGRPKEAKQKVPAAVFRKVVVGIDANGDFQVTARDGIRGKFNVPERREVDTEPRPNDPAVESFGQK